MEDAVDKAWPDLSPESRQIIRSGIAAGRATVAELTATDASKAKAELIRRVLETGYPDVVKRRALLAIEDGDAADFINAIAAGQAFHPKPPVCTCDLWLGPCHCAAGAAALARERGEAR